MITVNFTTPISAPRRAAFERAAQRWDETLNTSFAPVTVEGVTIDGVTIDAAVTPIDGEAGVLGQAGPSVLLPGSELPAKGVMEFDTADVERLEAEGSFEDVVLHEMAHVLGFGTLWNRFELIAASGTNNPLFTGAEAAREFGALEGGSARPVPIANTGGPGTREGHWRELIFGDELLTGFLSGTNRPISRMSLGSFADMGYEVDYAAADPFELPSFRKLAELGITEAVRICDLCRMGRPEPWVLDDAA
ncbi:MAG: leishmanolysin-related zinc metalloendopeptidase [Pseudomonadota bacterium]